MTDRVVYTALMGGYERLRPQPRAKRSPTRFVCFTDEPGLRSDDWEVVVVRPTFRHDPVRSARHIKALGHPAIAAAAETLWIDNRVELRADPDSLLDAWLGTTDAAFVDHSFRDRLVDEFTAVADAGLDDTNRVWEQLLHLSETHPHLLEAKPVWTGMIARRSAPAVDEFNHRWSALVDRYSRRDQLSVLQAAEDAELSFARFTLDNRESEWHEWPPVDDSLGRRPAYHDRWQDALRAPAITASVLRDRNQRLERRVQELEGEMLTARKAVDTAAATVAQVAELRAQVRALREEASTGESRAQDALRTRDDRIRALEQDLGVRRRAADRLRNELRLKQRELDGVLGSRTYRLAQAVRRLRPSPRR